MVSMKRPSRGERRSATTTRHTGSFFPPTRVSRMLTAIPARQDSASSHRCRMSWPRSGILPDCRPRIILRISPNCLTSWLTCWTVAALVRRHREDDRLDAIELAVVDLHLRELVAGEPRDHAEDRRERAHLADPLELVEEVLERELVLAELLLELLRLLL